MKAVKFVLMMLIVALGASVLHTWFETFVVGGYYRSASVFFVVLVGAMPIYVIVLGYYVLLALKRLKPSDLPWNDPPVALLAIALSVPLLDGCSKAQANVQTLVTHNCGVSWEIIKAGETVPVTVGPCSYKVTIPDYPMSGDTRFKASFKNRVLAGIEVSYEYSIVDGKVFIGEAKYVGKTNTDSDDPKNSAAVYERAENIVIDKRIREAAAKSLLTEDIVEFDQGEFEDKLLEAANELLKTKGVRLNFISFVPTPEEQTRLAIDMMTAMTIYRTRDMEALGMEVARARAGAPKLEVNLPPPPQAAAAE